MRCYLVPVDAPSLKPDHPLRAELRALILLATPIVVVQIGMMLLGVCDTMMVGRISQAALSGVSLGNIYSFAILVFGTGVIMVLDPLVSQAHGAGDKDRIALSLHRGIVISFVISVPFAILFLRGYPALLWLSNGQSEVAAIADQFVRWQTPMIPAWFLFVVLRQTLQGMGVVRPLVLTVLVGNAVNLVLDWGFIYGRMGLPNLGASGTAVATSIGRWVMVLFLAAVASPALARVWRRPTRELLQLRPYGTMLVKGAQIGLQVALEVWVFQLVTVLVIRMSTVEGAAQTAVINLVSLSFMAPLGVGAAAATRVGNAIGRRDGPAARHAAFVALAAGAAVMTISGVAFACFPEPILGLYGVDAEVVRVGAVLLPICGLFQVFDGTQAVGCGVLRGAGDTKAAAIINLVGYWFLGLPVGVVLTYRLGYGPAGLWWGLTIALAVVALLLVLRIRRTLGRRIADSEWVLAREAK